MRPHAVCQGRDHPERIIMHKTSTVLLDSNSKVASRKGWYKGRRAKLKELPIARPFPMVTDPCKEYLFKKSLCRPCSSPTFPVLVQIAVLAVPAVLSSRMSPAQHSVG